MMERLPKPTIEQQMKERNPAFFLGLDAKTARQVGELIREAYATGRRDGADELARRILEVLPTKQIAA